MIKQSLYRVVDALYLGRGIPRTINGERVRFPARYSRYFPTTYQAATYEFCRTYASCGSTVIDIGAHIGLFSVLLGRCVQPDGHVMSFEPTPDSYTALTTAVRLNNLDATVKCTPRAIAATDGMLDLFISDGPVSNANSLVPSAGKCLTVEALTLDQLKPRRPLSVIKIDVEGAEVGLLEGGTNLIAEHRPAIALDVHPAAVAHDGRRLKDLCQILSHLGYAARVRGSRERPTGVKRLDLPADPDLRVAVAATGGPLRQRVAVTAYG